MPAASTHETILLVEDEPAVRQLFAQALTRAGYSVYEARNGQEAMKLFDEHGDGIDMLLTDLRMPYMGGAEARAPSPAAAGARSSCCVSPAIPATSTPSCPSIFWRSRSRGTFY